MATLPSPPPGPPSAVRRWLRRFLVLVAIPYLGVAGLLFACQRSLIYVPKRVDSLPPPAASLPDAAAELVVCPTEDGLALHGWLLTSRAKSSLPESRRPLVIYFCGNAGHRGYRLQEFDLLIAAGANVLCCDYRGYGDNSGSPHESGLFADARAAWKFATQMRGVAPDRIVLFGESLGGGVATRLAAEVCAAGTPPAGLVLRSTFSSLTDVAAETYPWLPVRLLLRDRFPSIESIRGVTYPILVLHGAKDTIIPIAQGRRLFAAAPERSANGEAKQFVELPDADHNDVLEAEGPRMQQALREFLGRVAPGKNVTPS